MPIYKARHASVALFVVCACAIVGACKQTQTQTDDADASPAASANRGDAPQVNPLQSSELQDWASQATSGQSHRTDPASHAVARASSDALAPPVIHTVD